ncbi:MAG: GNAT family N-acetyltransferase [Pararhodobacter sp.]
MTNDPAAPSLPAGYVPGVIGRIAELHARHYAESHGFGVYFEAKVACELGEFLKRFDPARDHFRTVLVGGRVEGSIAIDGSAHEGDIAHLRWFLLSDELRGTGLGRRMLSEAITFCRTTGFREVYLWTLGDLHAAMRLYRDFGFQVSEEIAGAQWGRTAHEFRMVLRLAG